VSEGVRRWERGRGVIDDLVERRELQRVPADDEAARRMLDGARTHLTSAATIQDTDPEMALAVAYDAARKALAALLETQGLRATSQGGHIALRDAVLAQLDAYRAPSRYGRSIGSADADTPSSTWTRRSTPTKQRKHTSGQARSLPSPSCSWNSSRRTVSSAASWLVAARPRLGGHSSCRPPHEVTVRSRLAAQTAAVVRATLRRVAAAANQIAV
jgi:hypothetical protein